MGARRPRPTQREPADGTPARLALIERAHLLTCSGCCPASLPLQPPRPPPPSSWPTRSRAATRATTAAAATWLMRPPVRPSRLCPPRQRRIGGRCAGARPLGLVGQPDIPRRVGGRPAPVEEPAMASVGEPRPPDERRRWPRPAPRVRRERAFRWAPPWHSPPPPPQLGGGPQAGAVPQSAALRSPPRYDGKSMAPAAAAAVPPLSHPPPPANPARPVVVWGRDSQAEFIGVQLHADELANGKDHPVALLSRGRVFHGPPDT